MKTLNRVVPFLAGICLLGVPCQAALVGSQVTGSYTYADGGGLNYYDPTNGDVPPGYLNVGGTSVTITELATEFGVNFSEINLSTADFTNTQLILTDVVSTTGTFSPTQWTFMDNAFLGLRVTKVSDSYPSGGPSASLAGNLLTVDWGTADVTAENTYRAVFNITPVPEPSMLFLFVIGFGYALMRRHPRRVAESPERKRVERT